MPSLCCDTSFLFSLYGHDVHTVAAISAVRRLRQPLVLSSLNEYELANALRFAEYRELLSAGKAAIYLADFEADISAGKLVIEVCNLSEVIADAKRLSATQTLAGGHRSFDILHVAVAIHLSAREFLTFDDNQRKLAEAEGLKVPL